MWLMTIALVLDGSFAPGRDELLRKFVYRNDAVVMRAKVPALRKVVAIFE